MGVLLLSLSFGGVRFGGLALDLDSVSCAEFLSAFGPFLGDDLTVSDRDVSFCGLKLFLSFNFDGVRSEDLDSGSVCRLDVQPELVFVPLMGDGRAEAETFEFERDGGGVGAAGGLA